MSVFRWLGTRLSRKKRQAGSRPSRCVLRLETLEDRVVPASVQAISLINPLLVSSGNSFSSRFSLSQDGRYVAFESVANNLVAGDTNGASDVFVRDTLTGTITRASTSSTGNQVGGDSNAPAIVVDSSGNVFVAFQSTATNLVGDDTNGQVDIFVKNLTTGVTSRASTNSSGSEAFGASTKPVLALDGNGIVIAAFQSLADNLVDGDINETSDIFIKNLSTLQTTRVSTDSAGVEAIVPSANPALAVDETGTMYVAFESDSNVFVKNLSNGVLSIASTDDADTRGNDASAEPTLAIDASGHVLVAFHSDANNLTGDDSNGARDVFVKDLNSGVTTRVSTDSSGTQGNGESSGAAIIIDSGGIVLVAFHSTASNLVTDDTNLASDVFVKNLGTQVTSRISTSSASAQGDNASSSPALAKNGAGEIITAFHSLAANLVNGDDNASSDVFLKNLTTNATTAASRVSTSTPLLAGSSFATNYSLSKDGRYVAFQSANSSVISGDSNGVADIFVHDTLLGTISRVSTASNGSQANGASSAAAIAVNNSGVVYVAFQSDATNLVAGDNNGVTDVFVKNLSTGATIRVSTDGSGNQGNFPSSQPALAIDSNGIVYVAFGSDATNLVSGDTNSQPDAFVKNLSTGVTTRVSTDSSGIQGNSKSGYPALAVSSTDVAYIAFMSGADNLVADDTGPWTDIFIKNLATGVTTRVSTNSSGAQSNNESYFPSLAIDGSNVFVAFFSQASNLTSGDTNGVGDVFVKNITSGATTIVSVDEAGIQGNGSSSMPSLAIDSGGNVRVTFESSANNLVAGDTNAAKDIFIKNLTTATLTHVSTDATGNQANGDSSNPAIALNGSTTFVAYASLAGNLVVGDDNASSDVFLWQQSVVTAATHFAISAPASTTAGNAFNVTVSARDVSNNLATNYNGTIHFTSSDTQAVLPANATLTNGVGTFSITLKSVGNKTVTVTDTVSSGLTGSSAAIAVEGTIHLGVSVPSGVVAGNVMIVTVTALDDFGGTVTNYSGIIHITSSDTQASLSSNTTLINGVGFFAAVLKTAGAQTLSATDTVSSAINGTSGSINVQAAAVTSFFVDLPGGSFLAGSGFAFSVTARDLYLNTATDYTGTVHFASSDPQAVLPPDATLTNGSGMFSTVLKSAGTHILSATDTSIGSLTAGGTVTVDARPVSHFSVTLPVTSTTAGSALAISVTANDPFDNIVTGYGGTIHFTSSDGQAELPADATLNGGTGLFAAILKTAGNQSVSVTDTANSLTGNATIDVLATGGPATHFSVSAQSSTTAGNALIVVVTALDAINTTAAGYSGTVLFSSSDSQAFLPVNATLTNGIGYFAAILRTSGNQTVTATDVTAASINGTSNTVSVAVSTLHHLAVSAPSNAITGLPFDFTVAAQDQFNNTIPTYSGTVHFTSSDSNASLPVNDTLTNGARVFSATFKTSGSQLLTATDTGTASITGASGVIITRGLVVTGNTVTPTANGFTATFNKPFDPTVINLYDANSAFGVADVTLARNAIQTITFGTAGGFANGSTFTLAFNSSTTGAITYTTNAANLQTNIQNALNALSTVGAGNALVTALSTSSVRVMFQGNRGFQAVSLMTSPSPGGVPNPVQVTTTVGGSSNLRGSLLLNSTNTGLTFLLSSTGAGGVLPADIYQATIRSASTGFKDLLGASLDGNNDGVTGDSMVTTFTVATTPTVILSVPDFARGPDSIYNVRIPNGPAGEEVQTITFTGTANGSTFTLAYSGNTTLGPQTTTGITYSTVAATLQTNIQNALEALSNISGPNDFNFRRADVLVTATDASNVTVRFQNVLGGFDQPQMTATSAGSTVATGTSSPGVNTGIPISLVGGNLGAGVTAVTFDLLYDPALLNITGAYSLTGGSSFTLVGVPSGGTAHFSYSRNAAPALGTTATLGHIVANVPDSAETNFKTKQLLQLTSIVATGAAATVVGNSGVQIVAFFGDANGDGKVTGGDAALVSRVNSGTDTISGTTQVGGLGAYRMLDPFVMVALGNAGNGAVASGDVTLINSYLVRSQTQVPTPPPITDMSLAVVGPDPTLSLPSDLQAAAGETVVVPVNIDITRPGDSPGMMEAILALRYDTSVFTVSASDIQLGSVPNAGNGWQLRTAINAQTGEIGINIYSLNPILTRGGGSLVTVSLHVREGAVAGASAINLVTAVNPTGNSEYVTSVNDSINQYIINPVVTDGFDAGVDGRVTVPAPLVSTSITSAPQFVFTPGAATAEAAGFEPFEPVQLSAVITSELPEVVLEEVFGDFEAAALYLAASGLGNSTTQDTDKNQASTSAHDLAMLWSAEGVAGQDWMSDDSLSSLGKSLRRGKRLLAADVEDGSEETAGVEEFFARKQKALLPKHAKPA